MDILMLYRHLCHAQIEWGRAVSASELMYLSGLNRPTFYRYINRLIGCGFVIKPVRGFYQPCDIYRWHFNDIAGDDNEPR